MSYFEDIYDAWMANGCQGAVEDYDGSEIDVLENELTDATLFPFGYAAQDSMIGRLMTWKAVSDFIFAGKATFTIRSLKTQVRFTYKVTDLKSPPKYGLKSVHFVNLLRGPDNQKDFAYMGCILNRKDFKTGPKSRVSDDALSMKALRWMLQEMMTGGLMHPMLEVWHEGRCGRCGRLLNVPESISTGYGPECIGRF